MLRSTALTRWAIVGTSALALDAVLFMLAYALVQQAIVANAASSVGVVIYTYLIHHRWSFRSNRSHRSASLRYASTLLLAFAFNTAFIMFALRQGLTPLLAKLATIPVQAPVSFILQSKWVFAGENRRISDAPVEAERL